MIDPSMIDQQDPQERQIATANKLAGDVEEFLRGVFSRVNTLEFIVLVLSVLTAGSLWLLISEALPLPALWFGAIASTLTIGITLYLKSSGMGTKRSQALALLKDAEIFIGEVKAELLPYGEFWDRYKRLRTRLHELNYGKQE